MKMTAEHATAIAANVVVILGFLGWGTFHERHRDQSYADHIRAEEQRFSQIQSNEHEDVNKVSNKIDKLQDGMAILSSTQSRRTRELLNQIMQMREDNYSSMVYEQSQGVHLNGIIHTDDAIVGSTIAPEKPVKAHVHSKPLPKEDQPQ